MEVDVTLRATVEVPDDQDLDELAARIKSQGLGPEDEVQINSVLITHNGQDAMA